MLRCSTSKKSSLNNVVDSKLSIGQQVSYKSFLNLVYERGHMSCMNSLDLYQFRFQWYNGLGKYFCHVIIPIQPDPITEFLV